MTRNALAACLALAFAGVATAATNPFSDVPRTHWAYEAIQKSVDAGILQGFDGKFHGEKLVNRYQMAVIVKKILDKAGSMGGPAKAGMKAEDIKNLEALTIEFADELALLNVKVSTLEDSFVALRNEVDQMKAGKGASAGMKSTGIANAFTGFVSVGLINTDDQKVGGVFVPGGAASLTRYGAQADRTFFTIPQASIALDTEVSDGIGLHVQYDYGTDAPNAVGGGVALNEAYLFVDELFGNVGGKIGGFALPFQSWEINGPFRSCNDTITPSAKGTFLEAGRAVGLELTKTKDMDPSDIQWRIGIVSHGDAPNTPGVTPLGLHSDAVGLGSLAGAASLDDQFGFYIDLESGNDPDRNWGWRLGYMDLGGDATPGVGSSFAPTQEGDAWQVGFWWKNDDFKVVLEYLDGSTEGSVAGVKGPGTSTDLQTWYVLVNWKMNEKSSISLRYDDWQNEINTSPTTGTDGNGFTFAWNRKISDTSMFQFEWISLDNDTIPSAVTSVDTGDDVVQFRYKVWF